MYGMYRRLKLSREARKATRRRLLLLLLLLLASAAGWLLALALPAAAGMVRTYICKPPIGRLNTTFLRNHMGSES